MLPIGLTRFPLCRICLVRGFALGCPLFVGLLLGKLVLNPSLLSGSPSRLFIGAQFIAPLQKERPKNTSYYRYYVEEIVSHDNVLHKFYRLLCINCP